MEEEDSGAGAGAGERLGVRFGSAVQLASVR
jgi:hypothetical protein